MSHLKFDDIWVRPSILTARDRRTTRPGRPESPDDRSWQLDDSSGVATKSGRAAAAAAAAAGLMSRSSSSVGPKMSPRDDRQSEGRKLQFRKVGP